MKKILLGVLILVLLPIKVKAEEPPTDEVPGCTKSLCESIGEEYNICPELLEAIAYHESRFTPKAKNGNHYGMMQVNVEVHKERLENHGWTKEDMYTPYRNLVIAIYVAITSVGLCTLVLYMFNYFKGLKRYTVIRLLNKKLLIMQRGTETE